MNTSETPTTNSGVIWGPPTVVSKKRMIPREELGAEAPVGFECVNFTMFHSFPAPHVFIQFNH